MPVSTCCRESSAARWQGHAVAMHAHINLTNLACICFPTFIILFPRQTMVEANTIRGCLQTFGMDDAITRTFVTGPMVGLSTALAFIEMSDDSLKEVMKQVAEASRDAAFGAAPPAGGGAPPFVAVANRPKPKTQS